MLEKVIEQKLVNGVRKKGGLCLKFESPGCTGVPDRIIITPRGDVWFAELKAPGKKERPRQLLVQKRLRDRGCVVFSAVDSEEKVAEILEKI